MTNGSVIFSNGTTLAQDNSTFFWDNTNKRLGLGTNSPSTSLHVKGDYFRLNNGFKFSTDGGNSAEFSSPAQLYFYASTPIGSLPSGQSELNVADGRVGINDQVPDYALDVNGDVRVVSRTGIPIYSSFFDSNGKFIENQEIYRRGDAQSFSFASKSTAGYEMGTDVGNSYIWKTSTLNTSFNSGLSLNGTYSDPQSTVNLTAYGVRSGGYNSRLRLQTTFETSVVDRIVLDNNGVTVPTLAGSGTRMVTTTSTGNLGSAAIPTGTMTSWNFSVNGGAAYNMGDGWNQNFANGTGISWSRSGQTLTATNTGDLSNTNELQSISTSGAAGNITLSSGGNTLNLNVNDADASSTNELQTLSFSSPNLSISGSGGNSVALPVLPSGSTNQTLRHDGSSWSSTSGVTVTSGNRMDINSWPGTVNLGSKLLVNGHIQYTNTGFAATTLTGRDGDGGLTSVGVGSGLSLASGTLSATDASISNEGSLTVGAGSSTTSTISSNTSGSTAVTLSAGNGLIISEPGSNTVELDKYREYAHVYGNGSQNITTTTSNVQILQGDVTPVNMTVNPSSDRINTAGAIYTVAYKWTVFGTIYNSSTTPSEVRVSMLRNGVVSYTYNEIYITCGQGNTNFSMSGISGGSENFGWEVVTGPSPSGVLQLNNFHATVERL